MDEKWDVCFVENDEGELVIRNVAEPEKDSVYILNDTQPAVIHNYAVNVPVVARHEILSTMCHICTESRSVLRNVDDVVEDVTYRELLKASFPDIVCRWRSLVFFLALMRFFFCRTVTFSMSSI